MVTYDIEGNPVDDGSDALVSSGALINFQNSLQPIDTSSSSLSGFDVAYQPTDPNNTGDTGSKFNVSSTPNASLNNPETSGTSTYGSALTTAISAAFAGFQIASQPQGTAKTITTKVGNTTVVSGATGLSSVFGATTQSQNSILLLIVIVVAFILWVRYK
jgi:hypothetical protein